MFTAKCSDFTHQILRKGTNKYTLFCWCNILRKQLKDRKDNQVKSTICCNDIFSFYLRNIDQRSYEKLLPIPNFSVGKTKVLIYQHRKPQIHIKLNKNYEKLVVDQFFQDILLHLKQNEWNENNIFLAS